MSSVIVKSGRYTADPLYQWDVNQGLEIRGLSLPSTPEIHFTNEAMERTIVRQATMDDAGIITVDVPNSLLQKPYTITAYVCIYEGETFKSLYAINIPVKARKQPSDYTLENDEEVYSFNRLENLINKSVSDYEAVNAKFEEVNVKYNETVAIYNEAIELVNESNDKLEQAIANAEKSKEDYNEAAKAYNDTAEMIRQFTENSSDILEAITSKANKPTVTEATLLASGWSGNTYSLEASYPSDTHNIEIALNSTATAIQAEAFNSAQIVGSATSNIITAFGDVPTVDIPIIVKAVIK